MSTYLLFYRGSDRTGALYSIAVDGTTTPMTQASDFAPDWDKIVSVETVWDAYERTARSDILFHRGQAGGGAGSLYAVDGAGELHPLRDHNVLARGWTAIVPLAYEYQTNVLFYDRAAGAVEIRRYVSSTGPLAHFDDSGAQRGDGNLPLLKRHTSLPTTWTHLVAGSFGGAFGGLLAYDTATGAGTIYRVTKNGDVQPLRASTDFARAWTHIIPLPFGFRTDLFFYNRVNGSGSTYRVDDQGALQVLQTFPAGSLNTTWRHIVAIPFENDFRGPLLLFYDGTGTGELYRVNGLGELHFVRKDAYDGGWTHITAIPGYMAPPIHRIRLQALIGCEENDAADRQRALDFSTNAVPQAVVGANRIFQEAGIVLEYDPVTDADVIPSRLITYEKLPGIVGNPPLDPTTDILVSEPAAAMEQAGWRHRDKLMVVYFKHLLGPNYSTFCQQEVVMARGEGRGGMHTHELGHYFGLHHTHTAGYGSSDADFERLTADIRSWVEAQPEVQAALAQQQPIPEHLFEPVVAQHLDADRGGNGVLDTPIDLGPDIFRWTHIVGTSERRLLLYDGRTGEGAVQRERSDGSLEHVRHHADFSRNWTHIVSAPNGLLLFYKAHKGEGAVLRLNGDGSFTTLKTSTDFSRNWSHIVAAQHGLLLFYKEHSGEAAVLRLNTDGSLTTLTSFTDFSRNWSHIVAAPNGLLLFYKAHKGEAAVLRLSTDGSFTTLKTYTDFSLNWTHIVATPNGLLLFYKEHKGEAAILRLNDDSTFTTVRTYAEGSLAREWTTITITAESHVVYYSRTLGRIVIQQLQNDGGLSTRYQDDDPADYKIHGILRVTVAFANGQEHTYRFNADRANAMAYYHDLPRASPRFHFSADQVHRIRQTLQHDNRRHLVRPFEFRIRDC